jgi:hypothetical protein
VPVVRRGEVVMGLKSRLRTTCVCLVLEFGVLFGVQMPPDKIRALLDALNQPKLAHVLPSEEDEGDGNDERNRQR